MCQNILVMSTQNDNDERYEIRGKIQLWPLLLDVNYYKNMSKIFPITEETETLITVS